MSGGCVRIVGVIGGSGVLMGRGIGECVGG